MFSAIHINIFKYNPRNESKSPPHLALFFLYRFNTVSRKIKCFRDEMTMWAARVKNLLPHLRFPLRVSLHEVQTAKISSLLFFCQKERGLENYRRKGQMESHRNYEVKFCSQRLPEFSVFNTLYVPVPPLRPLQLM